MLLLTFPGLGLMFFLFVDDGDRVDFAEELDIPFEIEDINLQRLYGVTRFSPLMPGDYYPPWPCTVYQGGITYNRVPRGGLVVDSGATLLCWDLSHSRSGIEAHLHIVDVTVRAPVVGLYRQ